MTAIGTFIQLLPTKYEDKEFRSDFHKIAMEETIAEMQELRRQAASSIVVPEAGAGLGVPGGPGKIKLP